MPADIPAPCGKLQSAGEGVWSHPPEGIWTSTLVAKYSMKESCVYDL